MHINTPDIPVSPKYACECAVSAAKEMLSRMHYISESIDVAHATAFLAYEQAKAADSPQLQKTYDLLVRTVELKAAWAKLEIPVDCVKYSAERLEK